MSHNIHYADYKEKVNRREVQAYWDDYAAHEDWQEGCSGLSQPIRWLDNVEPLGSLEDAEYYIKTHDSGWYDQLAVRYLETPAATTPEPKTLTELRERQKRLYDRWMELDTKNHYKGTSAQFVTCRGCGSKLSTAFVDKYRNTCPVCRGDIRPPSALEAISRAKANYEKTKADVNAAEKRFREKEAKKLKPEVRWLVKIEYHT